MKLSTRDANRSSATTSSTGHPVRRPGQTFDDYTRNWLDSLIGATDPAGGMVFPLILPAQSDSWLPRTVGRSPLGISNPLLTGGEMHLYTDGHTNSSADDEIRRVLELLAANQGRYPRHIPIDNPNGTTSWASMP